MNFDLNCAIYLTRNHVLSGVVRNPAWKHHRKTAADPWSRTSHMSSSCDLQASSYLLFCPDCVG